jgi:hypothetical protein
VATGETVPSAFARRVVSTGAQPWSAAPALRTRRGCACITVVNEPSGLAYVCAVSERSASASTREPERRAAAPAPARSAATASTVPPAGGAGGGAAGAGAAPVRPAATRAAARAAATAVRGSAERGRADTWYLPVRVVLSGDRAFVIKRGAYGRRAGLDNGASRRMRKSAIVNRDATGKPPDIGAGYGRHDVRDCATGARVPCLPPDRG